MYIKLKIQSTNPDAPFKPETLELFISEQTKVLEDESEVLTVQRVLTQTLLNGTMKEDTTANYPLEVANMVLSGFKREVNLAALNQILSQENYEALEVL